MATFNEISVNSTIRIKKAELTTLGFVDGNIVSKSKYSLTDGLLSLVTSTREFISIFYNNGIATTYEFKINLYEPGVILPQTDANNKPLANLVQSKTLVFIDGELQPSSAYTVLDANNIRINNSYANTLSKQSEIIIYSTTDTFIRNTVPANTINAIHLIYKPSNTIFFKNGKAINFNLIEYVNEEGLPTNTKNAQYVKLNLTVKNTDLIEYIQFNNTLSLNFNSTFGYYTYGPYDDFNQKIPLYYDTLVTFNDQAKILIDNIRPGFVIKVKNDVGQLLIVDNTFETTQVRCLEIEAFREASYLKDEYYIEVPETKSIVNYLAEFDKKYVFIPEILTIFQRLLLDEMQDTVQRLRDARSIDKVDSVSINKLISLLGFNLNIKTLNNKQRHELLEELTEYYRIVGTRNSYNLINILQNNLKIINLEQLFTSKATRETADPSKIAYHYNYIIDPLYKGSGYTTHNVLTTNIEGRDICIKVMELADAQGGIKTVEGTPVEDYGPINGIFDLIPKAKGKINVNSVPILYDYTYDYVPKPTASIYAVNDVLSTLDHTYSFKVTAVSGGRIQAIQPLTATQGQVELPTTPMDLYSDTGTTHNFNITSIDTTKVLYGTYTNTASPTTLVLPAGSYEFELSGAGGAGGTGWYDHGGDGAAYGENGAAGELVTGKFALETATQCTYILGIGGTAGIAPRFGGGEGSTGTGGAGYQSGNNGIKYWMHHKHHKAFSHTYWNYGTTSGAGGGSSYFKYNTTEIVSRGGNGGKGIITYGGYREISGGVGGSGGVTAGGGATGGAGKAQYKGNSTRGNPGANGYLKIYRYTERYEATYASGDESLIQPGNTLSFTHNNVDFTITASSGSPRQYSVSATSYLLYLSGVYGARLGASKVPEKLVITSTPHTYAYTVNFTPYNYALLQNQDVLSNLDSPSTERFTVNILNISNPSNYYDYSPKQGQTELTIVDAPVYDTVCGTNAKLTITSTLLSQSAKDREYIDFYTREQLGAVLKQEYREDTIDYGSIAVGTPKSPKFWETGVPDIDYGLITMGTPLSPDPTVSPAYSDLNYGLITTKVSGKYLEWWEWDRKSNWYPTNHVVVEIKMPVDADFNEYVEQFYDQFYSLASTVVYIHTLIESFFFGNETISANTDGQSNAPFGILTNQPIEMYLQTVTSDPARQYVPSSI